MDFFHSIESKLSVSEAAEKIEQAAKAENFGVLSVLNFTEIMAGRGVQYDGEVIVIEICEPSQAKGFLEMDPTVASMLPCRISVTSKRGKTVVHSLRPSAMADLYQNEKMRAPAAEMEKIVRKIMESAQG